MKLTKEQKSWIPLYTYRIEWSEEDRAFVVSIEELPGCMTHGETQEEALKMGHEAVACHIGGMAKDNVEIPLPNGLQKFKGDFLVRATPQIHKLLALKAKKEGYKTLNKFIVDKLSEIVD
jgi:predicted RNase H-like HicB family nuclease